MDLHASIIEISIAWLESLPIAVGLILTVVQLRHTQESQKFSNQLKITENHREIWSLLLSSDRFTRVLEPNVDLQITPVTNEETIFVTFLILHLKTTFRAEGVRLIVPAEALKKDVRWFFSLPIPKFVWEKSREFQDTEFILFVEGALHAQASARVKQ